MKIGINARMFVKSQHTGIARSVLEILKVWAEENEENEYYLFSNENIELGIKLPSNWHIVVQKYVINKGILWDEFELPKMLKKYKVDVFWGTNFSLPPKVKDIKYYVTIYDLAAFKIKGITEKNNLIKLQLNAKRACKRADKIIAISNATAEDIHNIFKVSRSKIAVSYCGGLSLEEKKRNIDINKVDDRLKFSENYFLFVGTIEPRKNIITIIKAFEYYIKQTNSDMKLVLAGKIGWLCEDVLKAAKESKYSDRILMPGFISDNDRVYLYANACAFIFPSLYEGFGIPILEAFEYNLPVITSRISSMPEVGGEAALYIDEPYDYKGLESLMEKVGSSTEVEKADLIQKIKKQKSKFSWNKNAEEIMRLFNE